MRVLITGGAGCLGSNLIEHWLPKGHQILVVDNFATGKRELVPPGIPGLTLMEGSIADIDLVNRAFERFSPSHVVHAAAAYKDPDDWREDVSSNVLGTINVVDASRRAGVERFINLQTALCYGRPATLPIPVEHACFPVSSYGISKTAAENYVVISGLSFVSVRLASVIGPRLAIGAIPTFYSRLKAGKSVFCTTAVRDFLDMSDFLLFMDRVLEGSEVGIFNLGPGVGHSITDVLTAVCKAMDLPTPSPIDVRPVSTDDVECVILDPTETVKSFGWRHGVDFEDAVSRMVRWYDQFGVSAIHSHLRAPAPHES
jgi:UDP-glucose 4-epimerase